MNYLLLKSKVRIDGVAVIAERAYLFTLPSNKRDCVVNGTFIVNGETKEMGAMRFNHYIGKKLTLKTDWLDPDLKDVNLKKADRTKDWRDYLRKLTKKWDKKDVKMLISAIEHDCNEIVKIFNDTKRLNKKK